MAIERLVAQDCGPRFTVIEGLPYERPQTSMSDSDVAATAQEALAQGTAAPAIRVAQEQDISSIALSGGVAYNDHIVSSIRERCEARGYSFFTNGLVPCGDGGVSLGQAEMAGLEMRLVGAESWQQVP